MREKLLEAIRGAGEEAYELDLGGGTIVVLPHGGRILGLFPPGGGENFFWTNPALLGADSARDLFASEGWHNPGGDRTWLAPEVDFFFPDYPKLDRYVQPRGLDTERYAVALRGGGATLTTAVRATLSRSRIEAEVEIRKEVAEAPNPLRHDRELADLRDVEYAGYRLRTGVRFVGGERSSRAWVGAWNLLQLPHGGEMVLPTFGRAEPRVYFGNLSPGDLTVSEGLVIWRMRAPGEHKIGLRAVSCAGRAGYLYRSGERWSLVVRSFRVDPSGEYVDVPPADPHDLGYAFQACSIDSALGAFSELEHHAPAASAASGGVSEDVSELWAFRGPLAPVRRVAARLLGFPAGGSEP